MTYVSYPYTKIRALVQLEMVALSERKRFHHLRPHSVVFSFLPFNIMGSFNEDHLRHHLFLVEVLSRQNDHLGEVHFFQSPDISECKLIVCIVCYASRIHL